MRSYPVLILLAATVPVEASSVLLVGTTTPGNLALNLSVASCCVVAQGFTLTSDAQISAISVQMRGFGSDPFTLWVTNAIGPAATAANVEYQTTLMFPNTGGGAFNSGATVTAAPANLSLSAGSYFLVESSQQTSTSQGWLGPTSPLSTPYGSVGQTMTGASTNPTFPPGSSLANFVGFSPLAFQIYGNAPPSLLTLANLSSNVYSGVLGGGYGGYNPIATNCSRIPSQCSYVGFQAIAYATADKSQIVIAFRGTDLGDPLTALKNVLSDTSFTDNTPSSNLRVSVADAATFVQTIHTLYPDATITLTGHSLGGAIAQLIGEASGLTADGFNAPGGSQLYVQLLTELAPVSHLSSDGANTNYRLYGDQVSLAGQPIESTVILPDPAGTTLPVSLDPVKTVVDNIETFVNLHSISTLINQLNSQPVSSSGEPNFVTPLENVIAAEAESEDSTSTTLGFLFSAADIDTAYLLDPDGGTDFTLTAQSGSPYFASIDLPPLAGIISYDLRFKIGNVWQPFQIVNPGTQYFFPAGVDGIEFDRSTRPAMALQYLDSYLT